jgi:predicted amidohydrolase YtcJ
MRFACCAGTAALVRGVAGNLTVPAFAPPAAAPANGSSRGPRARATQPERAVILRGGPILTMDDANPVGEALAIRGSTILEVGTLTEVKRHYTRGTEIVDLEGHAVLPGFVESNVHVLRSALAAAGIDADADARAAVRLLAEDPERVAELGARTLREFALRGCTTVYDAGIGLLAGEAEHRLLGRLARCADAPVRLRGALTAELAAALGASPGAGDERCETVGISFWADGPVADFAAAVGEPYLNGRGDGALVHEEAELREAMRTWHRAGRQLVVHARGERAIEQVLRCYEAVLSEVSPAEVSHRIEHFTLARADQVARAAELGLSVGHTINEVYLQGEHLRDHVLGRERAERIHPLRAEAKRGVSSSCHGDSPACPVDPCLALRTATTRLMRGSDDTLGRVEQLPIDEALRTVTSNPAHAVLLGNRVGALRPGMLADLVVLDRDPRAVPPERLHELRVIETWLGGRRVPL